MDIEGQTSAEFIMLMGFMLLVTCTVAHFIGEDSELTHAMAAARTGATEGVIADSVAVYPEDTFEKYMQEHRRLVSPSGVKIVKVGYKNEGFNAAYNRTKIQLQIYATGSRMNEEERYRLGQRINYYARRSICQVFNTENIDNTAFNPAFTNRYFFTTAGVEWI